MGKDDDQPLAGQKVVVTRARHQARTLADALEVLGADVIEFPTITIRPVPLPPDLPPIDSFDWIIFTSANAVRYFSRGLVDADRSAWEGAEVPVCVVGPATAKAAEESGRHVTLMPHEFIAEGVMEALSRDGAGLAGKRILIPHADIAREFLPEALREAGADVHEAVVYRTACPDVDDAVVERFINAQPDIITFTSSSTATNFAHILGKSMLKQLQSHARFISIGPETTEAMRATGVQPAAEAKPHNIGGLIDAIVHVAATAQQ